MRLKSGLLFIIILHPVIIFSQQLPDGYDGVSNLQQQVWMNKRLAQTNSGYSNVQGTPLVFKEFHTGNFYFSNKTCISGKQINYNCYTDEVLFSEENNTYTANSENIDYFTLTGNEDRAILLFKQVFLLSEKKRVFMQLLYQGESILFKRYRKEFLKADIDKPYGQNRQVDEYNDYHEYYVMTGEQEPVLLKPRKSSLIEIFSDKSDLMEDFIKKEKIDLKNETDLVELVKHYDNI